VGTFFSLFISEQTKMYGLSFFFLGWMKQFGSLIFLLFWIGAGRMNINDTFSVSFGFYLSCRR